MNNPSLVIMAAGASSRFGGCKQLAPVDGHGQCLLEYSLHDAYCAGFRKVIFVIRKELENEFKNKFWHLGRWFEVRYAFQDVDDLPDGFVCAGRTKPWGTVHAILCARDTINEPFAVINADDFYGADAFRKMFDFLSADHKCNECAMIGYNLRDTLPENGKVTRGVCVVEDDRLVLIKEQKNVFLRNGHIVFGALDDDCEYDSAFMASMNFWGFQPEMILMLERAFHQFLINAWGHDCEDVAEFVLPTAVNDLIQSGWINVHVIRTHTKDWCGLTAHRDLDDVTNKLREFRVDRKYPVKFPWNY